MCGSTMMRCSCPSLEWTWDQRPSQVNKTVPEPRHSPANILNISTTSILLVPTSTLPRAPGTTCSNRQLSLATHLENTALEQPQPFSSGSETEVKQWRHCATLTYEISDILPYMYTPFKMSYWTAILNSTYEHPAPFPLWDRYISFTLRCSLTPLSSTVWHKAECILKLCSSKTFQDV